MAIKRQVLIQPYMPGYTENLGDDTGQYSSEDIGKAVKYDGDAMVECADGDEIVGFVTSVEPGTQDGYSLGTVRKNGRIEAVDPAGTLAVGDAVIAGAAGTLGTYAPANVKVAAGATVYTWVVLAAADAAGDTVVLERV